MPNHWFRSIHSLSRFPFRTSNFPSRPLFKPQFYSISSASTTTPSSSNHRVSFENNLLFSRASTTTGSKNENKKNNNTWSYGYLTVPLIATLSAFYFTNNRTVHASTMVTGIFINILF